MDKHLKDFTKEIDDLELQLDMDINEVPEAFEEQKAKLTEMIDQAKASIDSLELGEQATALQTKLDEMRVQAALGKAESKEAFEEQRSKIDSTLNQISAEAKSMVEIADETVSSWQEDFSQAIEKMQTRMDVLKVQFHLGMADTKDEYEAKRKELKTQLHDMKTRAEAKSEAREEKAEGFMEEMGEAFGHFKKGIRGLFS